MQGAFKSRKRLPTTASRPDEPASGRKSLQTHKVRICLRPIGSLERARAHSGKRAAARAATGLRKGDPADGPWEVGDPAEGPRERGTPSPRAPGNGANCTKRGERGGKGQ